jgi:sortase B
MKSKVIAILILFVAIGTMIYSGGRLVATEQIHQEGVTAYVDISSKVKVASTVRAAALPASEGKQPIDGADIPGVAIDFDALKTVSGDAEAWLYSPGTPIDFPVMKADDYSYYLHHLPEGTWNDNGSLFIDYNNAPDFSDSLTVIYGHNMKSKMMFGSLVEYKNQKYFNEHPYMYLYTQDANYRIELLYGCVIGVGQWRERAFMYKENVSALIAYAAYNTTFESGASYADGDKVVALSTCSYEFDGARYVVVGILRDLK